MATAIQQTKSSMESGFLEKLGDRFNSFVEGCVNVIARVMGGSSNERRIKSLGYSRSKNAEAHAVIPGSVLGKVNALEQQMKALTDEELKGLSVKYKERIAKGETLDDLLPEAFAACREAARRTKGMRHYDVQIVGGAVLHGYATGLGSIAEMVTGEGKTLVATLRPTSTRWNSKGVHVVTVNDYLARRDCEWMLPIYNALGVTAAYIQCDMDPEDRRRAYECDITYGTNSEFGFDYLRDNMKIARHDDTELPPVLPPGAANPAQLRDHRRGGQHPDRRGANAADHQRPGVLGCPAASRKPTRSPARSPNWNARPARNSPRPASWSSAAPRATACRRSRRPIRARSTRRTRRPRASTSRSRRRSGPAT